MKRKILILLLGIILTLSISVAAEENYNFRKTKWGMERKEVKQKVDEDIYNENEKFVMYETTVANLESIMLFQFAQDKLVSAGYYFNESHSNSNLYIKEYKEIKEILTKKYGEPTRGGKYWLDELYKGEEEYYGTALSLGHLVFEFDWETKDTLIRLKLSGDNYEIDHVLLYEGKKLKNLKEKEEKEENQNNF